MAIERSSQYSKGRGRGQTSGAAWTSAGNAVADRIGVRPQSDWEAVLALFRSGLNDCAVARATGIPRETVREWRRNIGAACPDQVNSGGAGVVERQTRAPQKRVGESPCGFESHLRHDPSRSLPQRRRWSDTDLAEAARECISLRAVLRRLGLHASGANYKTVAAALGRLGIDTSHFLGQAHLRGSTHDWTPRLPLNTILVADSRYTSLRTLKRRLLADGLIQPWCSECGLSEWRGSRLALVLDHINGEPRDHRLENLRLLCPNCNSQTPTFAGRNKRRPRARVDASRTGSAL